MFATRKKMILMFKDLISEAQREGSFNPEANTDDIADVVMGIYLIAQFEWSHIDKYTPDFLQNKLNRFFDAMLCAYRP